METVNKEHDLALPSELTFQLRQLSMGTVGSGACIVVGGMNEPSSGSAASPALCQKCRLPVDSSPRKPEQESSQKQGA